MTVTIELKPETEKRLAEKARQNNLPIETFIEVFIEDNLDEEIETATEENKNSVREKETYEEWSARFHQWLDSHKDKNYPTLPDEAYSRENIY
jgi:predicted transcriptional regulator